MRRYFDIDETAIYILYKNKIIKNTNTDLLTYTEKNRRNRVFCRTTLDILQVGRGRRWTREYVEEARGESMPCTRGRSDLPRFGAVLRARVCLQLSLPYVSVAILDVQISAVSHSESVDRRFPVALPSVSDSNLTGTERHRIN